MIHEFAQKASLSQTEQRDLLKCYSNILSPKLSIGDEFVNQICLQFNKLLPPNENSRFSEMTLSKHAEGRMRGNRLKLYKTQLATIQNTEELINDGYFAIDQIVNHFEERD